MTADLKIVEKIQKLLNLSSNTTNQGEAEAALAQATRLMAKYNIDQQKLADNAIDPLAGFDSKLGVSYDKRMPTETVYILSILRDFFNINTMVCKNARGTKMGGIYFIGTDDNVSVARLIYNQLYIQFKRFFEQARARDHRLTTTDKRGYYNGLYKGLYVRLEKEMKAVGEELGLVIVKDPRIAEATDKFFNPENRKNVAVAKYSASQEVIKKGFEDSKRIQINQGIAAPQNDNKRFLLR